MFISRPVVLVLLACGLADVRPATVVQAGQGERSHQGLFFTMPSGWTSSIQQGRFVLMPASTTLDGVVIVVLSGAEKLGGRSLDDWLRAKMSADLAQGVKPLQSSPPTRGRSGALETLSAGRTVPDASGGVLLQVYQAISDGQQAGLAMAATASEAAMKTHLSGTQTIVQSLRFHAAVGAGTAPPSGGAAAASGQKADITMADVAGHWGHSSASYTEYVNSSGNRTGSSTIAWGVGYELVKDGTYAYTFGGIVDGRVVREKDSGTWGFERGNLVIRSTTKKPKEYYILGYQVAPDGVVFMTVLDAYYPRTKENIEMWAEKWVKKGKGRGAKQ